MNYFAYGSNINIEHFRKFCPEAVISRQHAILPNYKIELHTLPSAPQWKAFATVTASDEHHVHGVLYHIECPTEQKNLNRKEGVHLRWYEKKNVSIVLNDNDNNEEIQCTTYVMINGIIELNKPSIRYSKLFKNNHNMLISSCSLSPPLNRKTKCSVLSF